MGQIASAITALITLILAVRLGIRYAQRRRLHSLLYAVGLALAAVAAGADFAAFALERWLPIAFRLYWFSAAALVGLMGLGTGALVQNILQGQKNRVFGRWLMTLINAILIGVVAWLAVAAALFPVDSEVLAFTGELATSAPPGVKLPFVLTSSMGATVIFAGAIWSWWQTRHGYNLMIALGTLVFAAGGAAGSLGGVTAFYGAHLLGSIVLYLGVAGSLEDRKPPRRSAAA